MKTAEEWNEILKLGYRGIGVENVKQIQLDAYKQGMTDAADIVMRLRSTDMVLGHELVTAQRQILAARDNKTSL